MNLVTSSKMGKSIKDKKNSIIHHQAESIYQTPNKDQNKEEIKTKEKSREYGELGMKVRQKDGDETVRKNLHMEEQIRAEPKNAFNKKCFQKKRTILPINQLLDRQNSLSLSKRITPFRSSNKSVDSSKNSVRSYSKFLDKKGMVDPQESNLARRRQSQSRERRSVSNSKLIKQSIMRQDYC